MTIDTNYDPVANAFVIKVSGRFDFGVHQGFRSAVEQITSKMKIIVVDLYATEYMDSSALGMLLVLRDKVNTNQQTIKLINTRPEVKKILEIANFDKLFNLQ
jgi:HptB-dependent secretion and biofilm anti anti-sigma factor